MSIYEDGIKCPVCGKTMWFADEEIATLDDVGSATFDCPHCYVTLCVRGGEVIDFDRWMTEKAEQFGKE